MLYPISTRVTKFPADTITPISLYLRIRERYARSMLLESVDARSNESAFSYILASPLATFEVCAGKIRYTSSDKILTEVEISEDLSVVTALQKFRDSFKVENEQRYKFLSNGIFGYTAYDAVRYFEDIEIISQDKIPEISYSLYRHVIAIDHFQDELYLIENSLQTEAENSSEEFFNSIANLAANTYNFEICEHELASSSEQEYLRCIERCKQHIARGDVFQIVPSRHFSQNFKGDELTLYRALRSINPSPYMFFFDHGNFKILGSSPEAQLVVKGREARLFPIAGTYKRIGDEDADLRKAAALLQDEKENAEHVMLVDLARNDLNKLCRNVRVVDFKLTKLYSHLIHIVSCVGGILEDGIDSIELFASTFPMGTLSGAPKYRAMQLLSQYEPVPRGCYGGAIGYFGFNGECNHAIIIRSFVSQDGTLSYQAGAGIVADSVPQQELLEVENKLGALRAAFKIARGFNL